MALTPGDITKINGIYSGTPVEGDTETVLLAKSLRGSQLDGGSQDLTTDMWAASGTHRGVMLKLVGGGPAVIYLSGPIWLLNDGESVELDGIRNATDYLSATGTGTLYYIYRD